MTPSPRVTYAEGQRISADDLGSEQRYLLALDARHNLGEHTPGVAAGLAPSTDLSGDAIVTAGIAIDQQGRELLASSDTPSPAAPEANCLDLWVVYCLQALRQRQAGTYDCSPSAFGRSREFGQIVGSPAEAGSDPVPPYSGAVYIGRVDCTDTPDVGYVALVGQQVTDPGGRTTMQVGPSNGRDRNGFLVSATDSSGASHSKIAIDRQGNNTLWGDVSLLGYQADALLPSPVEGFLLRAVSLIPGDAGEQIRARITPLAGGANGPLLGLTFLSGGSPIGKMLKLARTAEDLKTQVEAFNKDSKLVSLSVVEMDPDKDKDVDVQAPSESLLTSQDTPLTATGGSLELRKWPDPQAVPVAPAPRGCTAPASRDTPSQLPNGISFTPPSQPAKGTPLPGAGTAAITENGAAVTQFRLDLGAKKDNDPFFRLSIGAPDENGDFQRWLTGDGTGNLGRDPNGSVMNLNVTGRTEQAPIQPDPTDPRFTALLVLAWLHGLQSSVQASTVVTLAFSEQPALIESNKAWQYKVTATNSSSAPVTADKLFETRTIAGQTLLTNIANQTVIPAGGNQVFTINHAAGDMGVTGDLSIEVRMSGKIGNFPWWKAANTGPIPVVQSPALDLSGLPTSAPPHAAFDYTFTIANPSDRTIHLDSVTLTQGGAPPLALPIAIPDVPAGGGQAFGPIPHAGGINADLPVQVSVNFTWAGGTASNVTANKTINSLADLQVDIQNVAPDPVAVGNHCTYDLVLTNVGNQKLTIPQAHGLKQQLTSAATGATGFVDIPLAADIQLDRNQSHTVPGIHTVNVPAGAVTKITLEIQPAYDRESRTWIPDTITQDINIV